MDFSQAIDKWMERRWSIGADPRAGNDVLHAAGTLDTVICNIDLTILLLCFNFFHILTRLRADRNILYYVFII